MTLATIEYAEQILEIFDETFGAGYMNITEIIDNITDPRNSFYIYLHHNRIAAVLLYKEVLMSEIIRKFNLKLESINEPVLYCQSICVKSEYQRKGLGKELLSESIKKIAQKYGRTSIFTCLWEYDGQIPAKRLFENNNFIFMKRIELPWYNKKDYHCIICNGRCKCSGNVYYVSIDAKN